MTKIKSSRLNGSALVIALLAVSALLTVGLGVARLVPKDFRATLALESSLRAEQAAWAGVEHALTLLKQQPFAEITTATGRPYGTYIRPTRDDDNCNIHRTLDRCKGIDRQLGTPVNQQSKAFTTLGSGSQYSLVVWHRRHNVGNTEAQAGTGEGLDDGLPASINQYRNGANINPTLDRDEVRRLDIKDTKKLTLKWKVVPSDRCVTQDLDSAGSNRTSMQVVYGLIDKDNQVVSRGQSTLQRVGQPIILDGANATVLSLRLLVTNPDQQKVRDCFARYSLANDSNDLTDTVDMGFDVIESTGESGGVRRKIRVLVDRESGKLLNIFDFGLACETCQGI